jgi:hypothetical protein
VLTGSGGFTAFLLADLGVTKTHARPHVSNDNPFSEAIHRAIYRTLQIPHEVMKPVRTWAPTESR